MTKGLEFNAQSPVVLERAPAQCCIAWLRQVRDDNHSSYRSVSFSLDYLFNPHNSPMRWVLPFPTFPTKTAHGRAQMERLLAPTWPSPLKTLCALTTHQSAVS